MSAQAQPCPIEKPSNACIARQPILTEDEKVCGYELLLRESPEENPLACDIESAIRATIDTLLVIGLDVLCDGRPAFINCTREMLLKEHIKLLPSDQVVVEIRETVAADDSVVEACQQLKQEGYAIALDNFMPGDARESLAPCANFIKVDHKKVSLEQCSALIKQYGQESCRMVAQRVETRQDFSLVRKTGFTQFQGYFFREPERMRARQIPANQAVYLRLLQAISKPEMDLVEVEDLIKREAGLCYRLLRYLNSPALGLSTSVQSIRHALALLGEREASRWIRMAATLVMGQEKSSDLVLSSLVRARFCELIAPKVSHGKSDLFLLGMLSLRDAILEVPMGVVMEGIPLDPILKRSLCAEKQARRRHFHRLRSDDGT